MTQKIGIINYGLSGNIYSIQKAIQEAGGEVKIIESSRQLSSVDKLVIPGVGSFKDAILELNNNKLIEPLKKAIAEKVTLGICLGMQILSDLGFEYGKTKGLSVIQGEVKPMIVDAKIPHMGYNTIEVTKRNKLLKGVEKEEFYFMHSYEFVNYTDVLALTNYKGHQFISALNKDNVYGVQFHPEKSRQAGLKVFKNFLNID